MASTWHKQFKRARWTSETCFTREAGRLCTTPLLYTVIDYKWSAESPTRRTVDMTQRGPIELFRDLIRIAEEEQRILVVPDSLHVYLHTPQS